MKGDITTKDTNHFNLKYRSKNVIYPKPIASVFLLLLFYFIGLISLELNSLSTISMDTYLLRQEILMKFALVPEFRLQGQLLTYHFIHFALVHYAYNGLLLLYYVQGLEKATSWKFVLISYFVFSTIWPVIVGLLFFSSVFFFPSLNNYLLHQGYYLGASIGIWGLIGLSVPSNHKRILFWFGIIVLFIPEFALKLLTGNNDVTSNIAHLLIFFVSWFFSSKYVIIENNNGKIGELKLNNSIDRFIIAGIIFHALGLIIYLMGILDN